METDEFTKYNTTNVSTSNHTGKEWVLVHEYCLCRVCKHVPSAFPMLYQVSVQENTQQVPAWPAHARGENDVSRCLMCCICSLLCDFTRHRLFSSVRNLVIQHPTPAMRDFQPMAALQKNRWQIKRTRRQPSPEPPLMCESMGEGTHQLLKQWFLLYIGRFQTAPFKQALYIYIYISNVCLKKVMVVVLTSKKWTTYDDIHHLCPSEKRLSCRVRSHTRLLKARSAHCTFATCFRTKGSSCDPEKYHPQGVGWKTLVFWKERVGLAVFFATEKKQV